MLGSALDALYLREPISQSDLAINCKDFHAPWEDPVLEPPFRRLADKAFLGWPDFDPRIVRVPTQWELHWRRPRRVVIKEVNPLACRWFMERYKPRVVFLLRHPAAVALSAQKHGWLGPKTEDWANRGAENGDTLRQAWSVVENNPACTTVFFESLCIQPVEEFRRLYEFAGLRWTDSVAERIVEYSRDSKDRIDAWRREASPEAVAAFRRNYSRYDLPWYRNDEDWWQILG
jgi:hypothetical protein